MPEAAENQTKETQAAPQSNDSALRTVIIGSSLIMWLLAIFMIYTLNGIKSELEKLNQTVTDLVPVVSALNMANFEVVDAQGKVVQRFKQIPAPAMAEGAGVPMDAEAAKKPNP